MSNVFEAKAAKDATSQTETAEPTTTCAKRYHARLLSHAAPLAKKTQVVADEMRAARSLHMPGSWLFWTGTGVLARSAYQKRLLATPLLNREDNVMCARQILARGGRIRCMKWKPIPAGYTPGPRKLTVDPTRTTISPAERQFAASLAPLVVRKGRFSELEKGTGFYHILQRTTDELIGYTEQPFRETVCTGAREMIGFYRHRLKSLSAKARKSQELMRATLAAAEATTRIELESSDERRLDLNSMVRELFKKSRGENQTPDFTVDTNPFEQLQHARDALSDERISAAPAGQYARLLKAWRQIEFALYARYRHKHTQRLADTFQRALDETEQAHNKLCICTN